MTAPCPECARLLAELCRVSYELGKAQGELEGLRLWTRPTITHGERGEFAGGRADCERDGASREPEGKRDR